MKVIEKALNGVILFEPSVYGDARGYFFESYRDSLLKEHGVNHEFLQDNESLSKKNVLRGLHLQRNPMAQGKLVRVASGAVLDVAVDVRSDSNTFGQHFKALLSHENKRIMYIPPGFAHGFLSLKENTRFLYKCTNYYNKESEDGILWNDPTLNIDWGIKNPIVSDKDLELPLFTNFKPE